MKHRKSTTRIVVGLLGIILALSLTLWIGCSDTEIPSNSEAAEEAMIAAAPSANRLEFVMAVQEEHTPWLMQVPGVVGTATGLGRGGLVVLVFTERPGVPSVPKWLDGVPVVTRVTGKIRALKHNPDHNGGPPGGDGPPGGGGGGGGGNDKVDPSARFVRPVPIGVSTGHPDITSGTIACRVKKGAKVYALSNNHIYADTNAGPIGINVLQPGPGDGGQDPADAIGTLYAYEEILFDGSGNTIDAAIALSSTANLDKLTPSDGYGTPKSTTIPASLGMKVMKYGRGSGQTEGEILGINSTVFVGYDNGTALFVGQLAISAGNFSKPGDSGALVVVQEGADARRPVGIVFAGGRGLTFANPIDDVLNAFGVTVDGD